MDQLVPIFLGYVEQGCQHLPGELHRHGTDPVELFVLGQRVEDGAGPGANEVCQSAQLLRCKGRGYGLALLIVLWGILHDKHGQVKGRIRVRVRVDDAAQADAALVDVRGK